MADGNKDGRGTPAIFIARYIRCHAKKTSIFSVSTESTSIVPLKVFIVIHGLPPHVHIQLGRLVATKAMGWLHFCSWAESLTLQN